MLTGSSRKLLLRVYGPQVEHLIDREAELAILRRLARKRIGPRLLGTFTNGRFEEFFHAQTLTPADLRDPNTSTHIAKRMRELHEGIDLLPGEREGGPTVFKNWDSWVDRCEQIISWIDKQVMSTNLPCTPKQEHWRHYGLVLGTEWSFFRQVVDKARSHVNDLSGGQKSVKEKLVFAHNDTQYGNLLRLTPSGESPLLLPANSHKRLVVIDFEYASANTPAEEFANHFTEWCYNYHHPSRPYRCTTEAYPTPHEQRRFIRSYVDHRPQFNFSAPSSTPNLGPRSPSMTPTMTPLPNPSTSTPSVGPTSSISAFMLDSRAPPGGFPFPSNYEAEEKAREEATEREVQRLMRETRLWRMVNSAQWIAWGLVQAKMPEEFEREAKEDFEEETDDLEIAKTKDGRPVAMTDPLDPEVQQLAEDARHDRPESRRQDEEHHEGDTVQVNGDHSIHAPSISVSTHDTDTNDSEIPGPTANAGPGKDEDEDTDEGEFDYLAYAQDRALFFWGDVVSLGIVKEEELPTELLGKIRRVEY